ncbi:MAG: GtrA family protein [Clostridia bacterium]|mgnify:CR=1 FL=1
MEKVDKKVAIPQVAGEFIRYLLVGGSAFILDTAVLYVFSKYVFRSLGRPGILFGAAIGFIAGLVYNYALSILFVFNKARERIKGREALSVAIFAIIGVGGLVLTELGMYIGLSILGDDMYIFVKVIVSGVVFVWNFVARKVTLFK